MDEAVDVLAAAMAECRPDHDYDKVRRLLDTAVKGAIAQKTEDADA